MAERKTVPSIRFKGFTGDWEQRKFNDSVVIERGGSPRPIDRFITNNENGLNWVKIGDAPKQGNYITKTAEKIIPEGLSKTREVHPGDLILSNSMTFGKPYIMAIDGCIHDGWLLIRDTKKIFDLKFLCVLLGTEHMLNQYRSMAAGSTVNNLNKDLVGKTIVLFPKSDEQKLIGSFFEYLNTLINLYQLKYEKLLNVKKAMLEKVFPKEGAKVPKIRFNGFIVDWERSKIKKITDRIIVGLATSVTPYYRESGVPLLRNMNIKENYLDDSDILYLDEKYAKANESKMIHANDVLTVHTGSNIGLTCITPEKYEGCLSFTTLITTPNKNTLDSLFLMQYMNSTLGKMKIEAIITAGGKPNLNSGDLEKLEVVHPNIEEQHDIGKFFQNLDNLITFHQHKIEKLKKIKKAMIEKMFV